MGAGASTSSTVVQFPEEAAIKTIVVKKDPIPTPRQKHVETKDDLNGEDKENRPKQQKVTSSSDELTIKRANINRVSMMSYKERKALDQNKGNNEKRTDDAGAKQANTKTRVKSKRSHGKMHIDLDVEAGSNTDIASNCSDEILKESNTVVDSDNRDRIKNDDNESIVSENSNDTIFLAVQIPKLMKQNAEDDDNNSDRDDTPILQRRERTDTDFIELVARENERNGAKGRYDVNTIGYYIAKSSTHDDAPDSARSVNKMTEQLRDALFEELKQREATRQESENSRLKQRPKMAMSRQTMVLRKVGLRYKYVTVPAYLPGQKLLPLSRVVRQSYGWLHGERHSAPLPGKAVPVNLM